MALGAIPIRLCYPLNIVIRCFFIVLMLLTNKQNRTRGKKRVKCPLFFLLSLLNCSFFALKCRKPPQNSPFSELKCKILHLNTQNQFRRSRIWNRAAVFFRFPIRQNGSKTASNKPTPFGSKKYSKKWPKIIQQSPLTTRCSCCKKRVKII